MASLCCCCCGEGQAFWAIGVVLVCGGGFNFGFLIKAEVTAKMRVGQILLNKSKQGFKILRLDAAFLASLICTYGLFTFVPVAAQTIAQGTNDRLASIAEYRATYREGF